MWDTDVGLCVVCTVSIKGCGNIVRYYIPMVHGTNIYFYKVKMVGKNSVFMIFL